MSPTNVTQPDPPGDEQRAAQPDDAPQPAGHATDARANHSQPGDDAPADPGRRESSGRVGRGTIIIGALALVIVAAATWFIIDSQGDKTQAALHSWDDPVDGVMPVTVEVDRSSDLELTCELIAVDKRYIVVGQLELKIPAGEPDRQRVDAEIPLRGDGIAPELVGCSQK